MRAITFGASSLVRLGRLIRSRPIFGGELGEHYYQERMATTSIETGLQSTRLAWKTNSRFLYSRISPEIPAFFSCAGLVTNSPAAWVPQVVIPARIMCRMLSRRTFDYLEASGETTVLFNTLAISKAQSTMMLWKRKATTSMSLSSSFRSKFTFFTGWAQRVPCTILAPGRRPLMNSPLRWLAFGMENDSALQTQMIFR